MNNIEKNKMDVVISECNNYVEKRQKWDDWGYLEGLSGYKEAVVVDNYDRTEEWFKTHSYGEGNAWETIIFPIVRKIGEDGHFGAERVNLEEFFNIVEGKTIGDLIDTLLPFVKGNEDKTLTEIVNIVMNREYNPEKNIHDEAMLFRLIYRFYLFVKENEIMKGKKGE